LRSNKLKRTAIFIALAAVAALSLVVSQEVCRRIRSTAQFNFETGDFSGWTKKFAASYSGQIVTNPVRRGRYAARFELRSGDDTGDGVRAEVKEMYCAPLGREIWYSLSTFIPPEFPIVETPVVITQWHASEDAGEKAAARSPVLAHRYINGNLIIDIRCSSQKIQHANDASGKVLYEQKNFPKGVWHDFLYRIRWSYRSDGLVDCWLDGKPIIDYRGPVGYNDTRGPYFKFGLYHHGGDKPCIIYHDEYRRGFSRSDVIAR
jgi:peptide/nickel transport system ATP-binding protein